MATLSFHIVSKANEGLVISPSELTETFLFGIPLKGKDGKQMSSGSIRSLIAAAQKEVEKYLAIKCIKQIYEESRDFILQEYRDWSFIRMTYPVVKAHSLKGYINDVQQIEYPKGWLSTKLTSDGELYYRHFYLTPGTTGAGSNSIIYSGITPHLGFYGNTHIPNYWRAIYCTGFSKTPDDILELISKLAALNLLLIMSDIMLPAGLSSLSVSLDGLSQSTSASTFAARIKAYKEDIETTFKRLKLYYKGIEIIAM